jgi:hypothetical protein
MDADHNTHREDKKPDGNTDRIATDADDQQLRAAAEYVSAEFIPQLTNALANIATDALSDDQGILQFRQAFLELDRLIVDAAETSESLEMINPPMLQAQNSAVRLLSETVTLATQPSPESVVSAWEACDDVNQAIKDVAHSDAMGEVLKRREGSAGVPQDARSWRTDQWTGEIQSALHGTTALNTVLDDSEVTAELLSATQGRVPIHMGVETVGENPDHVISVAPRLDPDDATELARGLITQSVAARPDTEKEN